MNIENADLLSFTLPDITEKEDDYISDEIDDPLNDAVESDYTTEQTTIKEEQKNSYRGQMSESGELFDPTIHKSPPSQTKLGKWRKISKTKNNENIESGEHQNADYMQEAQKAAILYANLHMIPFGEKGALKSTQDITALSNSFQRYFMEKGLTEIPVGLDVLLTGFNYSSMVCQREGNIEKVKKFFGKMKNIFKGNKAGKNKVEGKKESA